MRTALAGRPDRLITLCPDGHLGGQQQAALKVQDS